MQGSRALPDTLTGSGAGVRPTRRAAWRAWGPALAAAAVAGFTFFSVGLLGYNPTDDGNLLAQTYRILNGEVPHRDVTFSRPMGSALLHVIEFALPLPLFVASRLVGIIELVAASFLLAALAYRMPAREWRAQHCAGAVTASLVNMHTYPLLSWYTIDGLLFSAAGLLLVDRGVVSGRRGRVLAGMVCLGLAPLMKQSFAVAPLLGLARIAWPHRASARRALTALRPAVLVGVAPGVLYLAGLAIAGGLGDFFDQLFGAPPIWGREFFTAFRTAPPRAALLASVAGLVVLYLVLAVRRSGSGTAPIAAVAISLVIVGPVVAQRFRYAHVWSFQVFWLAVAFVLMTLIHRRRSSFAAISTLALGWMAALSLGYPLPSLVAGSIALLVVTEAWRMTRPQPRALAAALAIASVLATAFVGARWLDARRTLPYFARPASDLTERIDDVSPRFGSIETDPATAAYMRDLSSCVARYPATSVAVLPDNPGIYPALDLRNPFPIDWMFPEEIAQEKDRILATARDLGARGDYLVLFQTFGAQFLLEHDRVPIATAGSRPFFYDDPLGEAILAALPGERITCGPFVGTYAAAVRGGNP